VVASSWVPVASALFVTATALQAATGGEPSWPANVTSPGSSRSSFQPRVDES
jgi:hypothetical protein